MSLNWLGGCSPDTAEDASRCGTGCGNVSDEAPWIDARPVERGRASSASEPELPDSEPAAEGQPDTRTGRAFSEKQRHLLHNAQTQLLRKNSTKDGKVSMSTTKRWKL